MNRAVRYALVMVMTSAIVYSFLLVALSLGRLYGVKIYPQYIIPIAALAPLFFASYIGRGLVRTIKMPLNKTEFLTFSLISIVGIAVASFVTEAGIIFGFLSKDPEITFYEILFAPLSERYSVTTIFGMSFVISATSVAAFVTLLRIPAVINVRLRLAKAEAS